MLSNFIKRLQMLNRKQWAVGAALLGLAGAILFGFTHISGVTQGHSEVSSQSRKGLQRYTPTPAEWASLTIEPVTERSFRAETLTEGKVAVDEDRSTPVFSPYAGRVTKLMVRPGDSVAQGQPLFVIEAADTVQAQNDFITAMTGLNKAKSALDLARIQDTRAKDLFEGKAVPLKDYQQTQAALIQAQNDLRSSQTALEATRNKLRILGLTDEAISTFQEKGRIDPNTTIFSPIKGTVVQRKVGPGQYVTSGASDPVFVIGDLSTVWLTAFVRETDASRVSVGQEIGDGAAGSSVDGAHQLRLRGDRSCDPPASGPRHRGQQGRSVEAGNVRQCHDLFCRRSPGDRRAETGADLRGRSGAGLGRARGQVDRTAPDQARPHQWRPRRDRGQFEARRADRYQGQPVHRPRCVRQLT
jgi:multidrug resistance efflux pump